MPFQNPGITGDNSMCGSPPPAQPHRGRCSRWLVVNMLRRAPLRGALPPSPIPFPPASTATATQGQNLSNGQEEQCRGGEPGLLPSQNWGEGERSLDLPSVSTKQDKGCQILSLPCAYCTGKQTTETRARECLISLVLALGSLGMPSHPSTALLWLLELLSLDAQLLAEGLHLGRVDSVRLWHCAHAAGKLFVTAPISLVKLSGCAGISAHL